MSLNVSKQITSKLIESDKINESKTHSAVIESKDRSVNIIVYDKNANAPNLMKKYDQLIGLGFVNVFIYSKAVAWVKIFPAS